MRPRKRTLAECDPAYRAVGRLGLVRARKREWTPAASAFHMIWAYLEKASGLVDPVLLSDAVFDAVHHDP